MTTVVHRGVNSLIACVGKGYCKNGQMETKELADYVERKHYGRKNITQMQNWHQWMWS